MIDLDFIAVDGDIDIRGGGRLLRNGNELLDEKNGAGIDASNLSDENVESWIKKLITNKIAGSGIGVKDGVISGISIKQLWKNSNTSVNFVATTITLNSSDYDFLLTFFGSNKSDIKYENSTITTKGNNISMNAVICSSSSPYIYVINRSGVRNSDISYTFDECYQSTPSGTNTANHRLIPKYIYGIKVV